MRKPILIVSLFVMLALILSACAGLTPPPIATNAAASPTQAATQPASATAAGTPSTPECQVDNSSLYYQQLQNSLPKAGTTDWTQGPQNAYVNIIEYSDFQ